MIWHIFKKDWKLQWKFVILMAALQFASLIVLIKISPFTDNLPLRNLFELLFMASMVGLPFLIVAGVHLDPIPGVRQDWLARPIRRIDLLLAKLLFVLVAVHAPLLLADVLRGLAFGFPFGASLSAALSHGLFVFVIFSLPLFAFASLTKNMMEAITGVLFLFLGFAGLTLFLHQGSRDLPLGVTGLVWIQEAAMALVAIAGAAVVLSLQYFRRRTMLARGLTTAALLLALFTMFLPWNTAFALEQRMSPEPSAGASVAVSFDPTAPRYRRPADMYGDNERAAVFLPLRFENLPAGSVLISDRAEVFRGNAGEWDGREGSVLVRQSAGDPRPFSHLLLSLPADVYQRVKDEPAPLEIKLYLTLFRTAGSYTIAARNGSLHAPDLGDCVTKLNAAETAVRLGCVPLVRRPSCLGVQLRVPNGPANPPQFQCQGDYAPFFDALFVTPSATQNVPFRDVTGLAKYPVDGALLNQAQLAIDTYQPVDHFIRTVSIPNTRLRDWTVQQ